MEPATSAQKLAVRVKASDRNARQFAKVAVTLLVIFAIITLSFIAWHSITTTDELKKIATSNATIISKQGDEINTIKTNQTQNHIDSQSQLAAIEAYNKCLVSLFTHHDFVPTSALDSCTPVATQSSVPSNQGNTAPQGGSSKTATAQNSSGNSGGSTGGNNSGSGSGSGDNKCPSGQTGTPPNCMQPNLITKLIDALKL